MKGTSRWVRLTFDRLKNTQKTDHFGFSFTTKNLNYLLSYKKSNLLITKRKTYQILNLRFYNKQ